MSEWQRVSQRRRCPVCNHPDWCLLARDGSAAICPRVESDRRVSDAGWLHRLTDAPVPRRRRRRTIRVASTTGSVDATVQARQFQEAAGRMGRVEALSEPLGLSAEGLVRFGVGWCECEQVSTWPMCDAAGRVVGICRRFADGAKRVFPGHKAGIYMPTDLPADLSGQMLLIAEGATDAVSGADLGFPSVGRFSCSHGMRMLAELVRTRRPGLVVICSDVGNDNERRGAKSLASALVTVATAVKLIAPPEPHKDLRAWRQAGLTGKKLQAVIAAAPVICPKLTTKLMARMQRDRKERHGRRRANRT